MTEAPPRPAWAMYDPGPTIDWSLSFDDLIVPPYHAGDIHQPIGAFISNGAPKGKRIWTNTEAYQVWLDRVHLLQALPGCESDGASVPRAFWSLCPPLEPTTWPAAFCHDLTYAGELMTRQECDRMFYRMMRLGGTGKAKAGVMFGAVYGCGWVVWNRHTQESIDYALLRCRIITPD